MTALFGLWNISGDFVLFGFFLKVEQLSLKCIELMGKCRPFLTRIAVCDPRPDNIRQHKKNPEECNVFEHRDVSINSCEKAKVLNQQREYKCCYMKRQEDNVKDDPVLAHRVWVAPPFWSFKGN